METQYQPKLLRGKYEKRAPEDADTLPLRGFYISSEALFLADHLKEWLSFLYLIVQLSGGMEYWMLKVERPFIIP